MSNKFIALVVGTATLVGAAALAAGSANALPASPAKPVVTHSAQLAEYRPAIRPYRVMSHQQVRGVLRQSGYHNIHNIRYVNHYVVRGYRHGHQWFGAYRGPAYVATAVAPNGRRFDVAIDPRSYRTVGRTPR